MAKSNNNKQILQIIPNTVDAWISINGTGDLKTVACWALVSMCNGTITYVAPMIQGDNCLLQIVEEVKHKLVIK